MEDPIRIDINIPRDTRQAIAEAAAKAGFTSMRAFIRTLLIKKFRAKKAA